MTQEELMAMAEKDLTHHVVDPIYSGSINGIWQVKRDHSTEFAMVITSNRYGTTCMGSIRFIFPEINLGKMSHSSLRYLYENLDLPYKKDTITPEAKGFAMADIARIKVACQMIVSQK